MPMGVSVTGSQADHYWGSSSLALAVLVNLLARLLSAPPSSNHVWKFDRWSQGDPAPIGQRRCTAWEIGVMSLECWKRAQTRPPDEAAIAGSTDERRDGAGRCPSGWVVGGAQLYSRHSLTDGCKWSRKVST